MSDFSVNFPRYMGEVILRADRSLSIYMIIFLMICVCLDRPRCNDCLRVEEFIERANLDLTGSQKSVYKIYFVFEDARIAPKRDG